MPADASYSTHTRTLKQFGVFCVVGVINTAVDLLVYYLLTRFAGLSGNLVYAAKAASFLVATFNSYILNRTWTFKVTTPISLPELWKFYAAIGSGIFINVGVHMLNIAYFGMNDIASAIVAALCTAVWGFAMSKLFVFR